MPLPNRAHGRPGTTVFPPGWAADHAAVIDSTHASTVRVGPRATEAQWNPTSQQMESTGVDPVYDGPASISVAAIAAGDRTDTGDEVIEPRKYLVTLTAAAAGISTEHVVVVTACPDPDLVDAVLTIDGIEYGDQRFARHLTCTLT